MKTKLLVLDPFTNGHEAALEFASRLCWSSEGYEIIFCGSHKAVLQKLSEGPAYAVIAIRNSNGGPVKGMEADLVMYGELGFVFEKRHELHLQIDHCLAVPKHIQNAGDIERVISHDQALIQCSNFLDRLGVPPENRNGRDSTGAAAKAVSRMGPDSRIAAICSKNAANAYGLTILAEGIQNVVENVTTFHLLENEARIEPVTVGIVGIAGRVGQLLERFFKLLGCNVIGSDPKLPRTDNADIARRADVIIFSVQIMETPLVIDSLEPEIREDQLILDVTSVKTPAVEAMLKTKAQVVGLHPMFAPEVGFDGQTIVVCPERLTVARWKTWIMNVLAATGSKLKWSHPLEHDTYMSTVQANPHFSNMVSAVLLMEMDVSVRESLTFTSPFYRVMFSQVGRFLSQDPDLYSAIIMKNPATIPMVEKRIEIEKRLLEMIRGYDREGFRELFKKAREHFGREVAREANELFVRIIALTKTLGQKNSVILEFGKKDNQSGLLKKVAQVFDDHGVNLSGFNYAGLDDARHQFTLSFTEPKTSDSVRRALETIESWDTPKVTVIE